MHFIWWIEIIYDSEKSETDYDEFGEKEYIDGYYKYLDEIEEKEIQKKNIEMKKILNQKYAKIWIID